MSKPQQKAPVLIAIAAIVIILLIIAFQLPRTAISPEAQTPVTEPAAVNVEQAPQVIEAQAPVEGHESIAKKMPAGTEVGHKIDASSDTAMVDSLDYISRQLDPAGQKQLQDDYNVIQSALNGQGISDDLKEFDSLAAVRKAVDGKTAAELTEVANSLKPKN
jgi:hypothetical protein